MSTPMPTPTRAPIRFLAVTAVLLAATAACGVAPKSDTSSTKASASTCTPAKLALKTKGTLTVGTDSPAYPPWFEDNKPTNGKGYESAVAYAVAKKLGFSTGQVSWLTVPFNNSYAPGAKKFDFDINQISINAKRAKVVAFSRGYYTATQAVIALKNGKAAKATSLADLATLKIGAQTGTTSLSEIRDQIRPKAEPLVFDDTNVAKRALLNGQVDAIVADLPTAFYITSSEIPSATIVGQFKATGTAEKFGLLSEKGSALVPCLDYALDALDKDGTLASLEKTWLSETVSVPVLKQ
jgi:polar amino acid transport system substrate-binding protein